ncbi:MAG: bifunctional alpha,alpha-trehalose-phosphate synthase (UDP-forming)/trehalose-phosphatase [Patescibacteria group bacterium]|nr:bifunctional alpha,alpha-trehalose-phosphate synthase (UDP-forming)/trehalose-phosphatase [Patescibacteria group bacterium]
MPQILIVSNRLPVTVNKVDNKLSFDTSMGGVATGLASYVKSRKNKWIGWPGIASEDLTEKDKQQIITRLAKRNCVPVFLTKRQVEDFYNGYSNSLLWPLFHNLPMVAAKKRWWKAYQDVNTAFSQAVLKTVVGNSSVWIQDYQLMLLPELVKLDRPLLQVGFFMHIPFPEPKTFAKLPEANQLLSGVLGADLIGFHTKNYVSNFLKTVQAFDLGLSADDQLILPDRTVQVTNFPMGIDYEKFTAARKLPAVKTATKELKQRYKGLKIIAGVDRLDITKGFAERLIAYRDFLRQFPKEHGKIVFVLVGAPSRGEIDAYQQLSKKVDDLVAAINHEFGTPKWQPVDYNNQGLNFEALTALFQIADIAFIAPLRDGMNLVAKEYIASKKKNGVLILSETAGAAHELQDALLVSHKKPASLVAAIDQALHMRRREARGRFRRMQRHLADNTVHTWASDFMTTLQKPVPGTPKLLTRTLTPKLQTVIHARYLQANKRLILLDYDGTLVPFNGDYATNRAPKSLIQLLAKLTADPANTVVIASGRSADDLDACFDSLDVNLVAEHGAMIKSAGQHQWKTLVRSEGRWKRQLLPILRKYAAVTPLARVEEKPHSLVWHYRQSPPYYAQKNVVILKRILKPIVKSFGLTILAGNKVLEIKDPAITKGTAITKWLTKDYDFIVAIGDDITDEDLFTALPAASYTIKVRNGRTAANYRLASDKAVVSFLARLKNKSIV